MGILDIFRKGKNVNEGAVELSVIPQRTIVATTHAGGNWQGLEFNWPPTRLDLAKVTKGPKRSFQFGESIVLLLEDIPLDSPGNQDTKTRALVIPAKHVTVGQSGVFDSGIVPQIWVYAQRLLSADGPYLIVGAIYSEGVRLFVLSGPTSRLLEDEEYFVREAMALVVGLRKEKAAKFVEWDLGAKSRIATYSFASQSENLSLGVTRP
jgi:hypothetical protein